MGKIYEEYEDFVEAHVEWFQKKYGKTRKFIEISEQDKKTQPGFEPTLINNLKEIMITMEEISDGTYLRDWKSMLNHYAQKLDKIIKNLEEL